MEVVRTAAAALTKLLPTSTVDNNASGLSFSFLTWAAPNFFLSAKYLTLNLLKDSNADSHRAKNADRNIIIANNITCRYISILTHQLALFYILFKTSIFSRLKLLRKALPTLKAKSNLASLISWLS